ncbi:hypothetical protein B0O99DRAFT_642480 [Bisporella sp. PMI_857]|nr:hypothetical protein B0O99DRAFT_642480 [Bisporella sp. PMI_857]
MPSTLDASVLTAGGGLIYKVDTCNVEKRFSKSIAPSLGLWNGGTLCCDPISNVVNVLELSSSMDSFSNKEALEFDSGCTSLRKDPVNTRSRGLEKRATLGDLQRVVVAPAMKQRTKARPKTVLVKSQDLPNTVSSVTSDSIYSTSKSSTTCVVKAFSPGCISSLLSTIQEQKMTAFCGLSSSGSVDSSRQGALQQKKKPISNQKQPKNQTSFREKVATRTIQGVIQEEQSFDDDVFETDEEDIDESAIDDDDDSSEWEDSNEDSNTVSMDEETFFQRVDSRPQLTSRRSLLTVALYQNDRNNGLMIQATQASRSTPAKQRPRTSSPNGPSFAPSPDSGEAPLTMKKPPLKAIAEVPRTSPHPIPHSPRTTRRNMLATELTISLRQHLLWEQHQKFQTVNADLRRRVARDVTSLKQYPEMSYMRKDANEKKPLDYNSEGW